MPSKNPLWGRVGILADFRVRTKVTGCVKLLCANLPAKPVRASAAAVREFT